ncbi:unnamed protein product [Brachionus calyciflorus]|uniref:Nucleoporin NUP42 n=1 Tax=Brachionus calyciflorus TaxID=104777 RepID=A0A814CRS3_9BILA|nr:unnamed protein product [Brachionus calyciflorus]
MTVCRYYLQGNCRFGNKCHYEHPRGEQNYSNQQYRQDYRPQQQQQQQQQKQYQSQFRYQSQPQARKYDQEYSTPKSPDGAVDTHNFSDAEFLDYISNELSEWVNSSAWKLSCYSYTKMAPCIPILEDYSPEEVRFSLYEAKKNNTYTQTYNEYLSRLDQTINTIKQMINPNPQIREYLIKYFHESEQIIKNKNSGETVKKPENPFMKIVQAKQEQQQQQTKEQFQTDFFNKPIQQSTQQPNQFFGSFNQPQLHQAPPQQNLFAQIAQQQQPKQGSMFSDGFGQQQPKSPLFNLTTQHNNFQQLVQQPTQTNFFSQIVNMNPVQAPQKENTFFGKNIPISQQESKKIDMFYSSVNDLTKQELEEFKANQFTLGRIPNVPPAREFC